MPRTIDNAHVRLHGLFYGSQLSEFYGALVLVRSYQSKSHLIPSTSGCNKATQDGKGAGPAGPSNLKSQELP